MNDYDVRLPYFRIEKEYSFSALDTARSWGVARLGADKVHVKYDGSRAVAFIIDTEDVFTHPDVAPSNVETYNRRYTNEGPEVSSQGGHGLHVADTVRQMAPGVILAAMKGLTNSGRGFSTWIARAIREAADMPLLPEHEGFKRIIVMSLGSNYPSVTIREAVEYAADAGCFTFAAAGNDGSDVDFPGANEPFVIASAAIDENGDVPKWSSWGPEIDLVAPGVGVEAAYRTGYARLSGTSMANPHTAGAGILFLGLNPGAVGDVLSLEVRMEQLAVDVPPEGRDDVTGAGLPVVTNYIQAPDPPGPPPPPVEEPPEEPGVGIPLWLVIVIFAAVMIGIGLILIF